MQRMTAALAEIKGTRRAWRQWTGIETYDRQLLRVDAKSVGPVVPVIQCAACAAASEFIVGKSAQIPCNYTCAHARLACRRRVYDHTCRPTYNSVLHSLSV